MQGEDTDPGRSASGEPGLVDCILTQLECSNLSRLSKYKCIWSILSYTWHTLNSYVVFEDFFAKLEGMGNVSTTH